MIGATALSRLQEAALQAASMVTTANDPVDCHRPMNQ
jgi:hypothetical protein